MLVFVFFIGGARRKKGEKKRPSEANSHIRRPSLAKNDKTQKTKQQQVDLGTGNNNKINWAMEEKGEFIDIVEVVYRGARKGRGLVVSPKDYSTRYRY